MMRLFARRKNAEEGHGLNAREMDDIQLSRRMRALAVEIRTGGFSRLALGKSYLSRLRRAVAEAAEIDSKCEYGAGAVRLLVRESRLVESGIRQALAEGGSRLPASGRIPRILSVVRCILDNSGNEVDRERLLQGLSAFDDVQALTMEELWAVPSAVRIVIGRRMALAAEDILREARSRLAAEEWIGNPHSAVPENSPAFFEHALRMAAEQENGQATNKIEQILRRKNENPENMVRRAHEQEAARILTLERLLSCKRHIDAMDWRACFESLSNVDGELRCDPNGVYGNMDDASRDAVRRQVSVAARKLNLSEITIARYAVIAAGEAAEKGEPRKGTVCYWLMTDEGRGILARRMGVNGGKLPKLVPDPEGRVCVILILSLAAVFSALWILWTCSPFLILPGIPIAWMTANALIGRFFARMFPPAGLLGMKVENVKEDLRTLVVMPVLLNSSERAAQMCAQMEAAGCLESDRNIQYLLLGDFSDDIQPRRPEDADIVNTARAAVRRMNKRAGWEKYGYIHRPRTYLKVDRRWMGFDRKRGALMALNRLLMDMPGAEEAFSVEGAACSWLRKGFRFVVTLDADTRMVPGTVRKLVGLMAHPLNRRDDEGHGYGILQPNMEMMPSACKNEFVRLFAGCGGMNTYPVSVSGFWQDLTGEGMFQGKGIYDVKAFYESLEGALPEGRILSHDLIEGAIARTGFAGGVSFYDGYPINLGAVMKRLNRWTRGDWQLLPFIFSRKPLSGRKLTAPQRLRMIDNLMRSLYAPALLAALIVSVWLGSSAGLAAGILAAYISPILNLGNGDKLKWRRATAELSILPLTAWHMVDAVLRTVWRLFVSGKHMLDWVTAADAEKSRENTSTAGRIAAILLIPGLLPGGFPAAAIALAALFLVGPGWIRDMERESADAVEALSGEDIAVLNGLSQDTWRFFEKYVPVSGNGLPPDNVQTDPPVGPADRTSPTNIGLYLLSCLCARRMGFIREEEMIRRLNAAAVTIENMEKWSGHLYNWYDTGNAAPLRPRYVSSVDSGNLAACLLLVSRALENMNDGDEKDRSDLARRLWNLAEQMDFRALYDEKRKLFRIGFDVESGTPGTSHYDLLASESRILSYTAIMLGQVLPEHWNHLSRTAVNVSGANALVSWSGTMFEYLMPEIFMHAPAHSLIGRSNRAVLRLQKAIGKAKKRPWGISESGYYAFDMHMNYQYRAFGAKALALSGNAREDVVAPYACLLALPMDPAGVARNVRCMKEFGWADECGLFEAADYSRAKNGRPDVVRSHMAHHQGMILCALCNALEGDYLGKTFMDIPEARALELLLQEKPAAGARLKAAETSPADIESGEKRSMARGISREKRLGDAHMLCGGNATAFLTTDGCVHYVKNGIWATRFSGDIIDRKDGACLHIYDRDTGACCIPGSQGHMRFDAGFVQASCEVSGVKIDMKICISPEDGTLYRVLDFFNGRQTEARLTAADLIPAALATGDAVRAHSIFSNLFVESQPLGQRGILLRRRPRKTDETHPVLAHMTSEPDVRFETDYEKLTGRMGDTGRSGGINLPFTNSFGSVLDPVSAIAADIVLAAGETRRMHFAVNILDCEEDADMWMNERLSTGPADRAMQLSPVRAWAMLDFFGISPREHRILQRAGALFMDGRLSAALRRDHRPENGISRERLWEAGISGDLPIVFMAVNDSCQRENIRALMRMHGFYRAMGIRIDLVLVNDFGTGYDQPVRDMMSECIASGHLRDMQGVSGGVWVLDGSRLSENARNALERAACLCLKGDKDVFEQTGVLLQGLEIPAKRVPDVMDVGEGIPYGENLEKENGYGGFGKDGSYVIRLNPGKTTPAPWTNILAGENFGAVLTERGGGFFWHGNSRSGRLTPYGNDRLREGWGIMLYLADQNSGTFIKLLPGMKPDMPFTVRYDGVRAEYRFNTEKLEGRAVFFISGKQDGIRLRLELENKGLAEKEYQVVAFVNWQMGTDWQDNTMIRTWNDARACYASGTAAGAGWFACSDTGARPGPGRLEFLGRGGSDAPEGIFALPDAGGWTLKTPVVLEKNCRSTMEFALGWSDDVHRAREQVRDFCADRADGLRLAEENRRTFANALVIRTPDPALNAVANGFLIHQAVASRIMGRTGLYQPGGAYGFRDQLQDMLAVLHFDPERVRGHLLRCAAHQFEDGDVMHWWHEPALGVRTKISDDLLFLPWVTAAYVQYTGDRTILDERIPYLRNVEIPEGREDVFTQMHAGGVVESLHHHCMRAFRRAFRTGSHGLALMGAGDWNDGMNRVGMEGRGESVWLSEFMAACAKKYAAVAADERDRKYLENLAQDMIDAVEEQGWDGRWYLRAYTDDGEKLGSAENMVCRIDAISQAWAVFAGLDENRCTRALDSAWEMLADKRLGIVKLLTPPFEGNSVDPGYIRGYPSGVRENGAQYTHGACWLLLALIRAGREKQAHEMLEMLLPANHSDTKEKADRYRVEPYVMAADICSGPPNEGRGGWTWYTGAAAWMYACILGIMGYERRGDRVRLNALLGKWPEAGVDVRYGSSVYHLVSDRDTECITLDGKIIPDEYIAMTDDGKEHEARFPARKGM